MALDLFCGAAGGWSLGLHRAGVRTVAACEIDDWRRETFARNFPDVKVYADVRELGANRLLADLGRLPDWIVGSPPCQDASCVNTKGKGVDGERTGLFFEAIRLVGECRPRWAVFENVPGLRTRGADRVLAELEALGYACWPLVVGAWHAGAPHRRNRVWIVAADLDAARQPLGLAGQSRTTGLGAAADADGGELRQQPGRIDGADGASPAFVALDAGDARQELPAALRAIGQAWRAWGEPVARHLGVADGVPSRLARQCVSAYGDAVVPQVTETIARAILSVESEMMVAA